MVVCSLSNSTVLCSSAPPSLVHYWHLNTCICALCKVQLWLFSRCHIPVAKQMRNSEIRFTPEGPMNFIFANTVTIYSRQIMYICSFSTYTVGIGFLKDPLGMQDKPGENQKLFSTSSMQPCLSCIFCFKGDVKIGSRCSADTQPWTLTTLFLTPNLLTSFANFLVLAKSSKNLTDKYWKYHKTPEWLRWSSTKQQHRKAKHLLQPPVWNNTRMAYVMA